MLVRVRNILGTEPYLQSSGFSRLVQLFVRQGTMLGVRTGDKNWDKPLQLRFPTAGGSAPAGRLPRPRLGQLPFPSHSFQQTLHSRWDVGAWPQAFVSRMPSSNRQRGPGEAHSCRRPSWISSQGTGALPCVCEYPEVAVASSGLHFSGFSHHTSACSLRKPAKASSSSAIPADFLDYSPKL